MKSPCYPYGGINKDKSSSPHGNLDAKAAAAATKATKLFLSNLQADAHITKDQVKKLLCGATLAIGIEVPKKPAGGNNTVASVGNTIELVKNAAIAIVEKRLGTDEEPAQYVLATFNDEEVPPPFVTTDPAAFEAAIRNLSANGGGDCREMAGGGMFEAISAASSGGSLFLFTGASVKDPAMLREAIELAAKKKIQVFFPVFGSCGFDAAGTDPVYEEAAEITGGQVFSLDDSEAGQIANLLDNVSRTTDVNILSIRDSLGPTPSAYTVLIDNTVTAVTFSVSGDTSVTLTRPDRSTVKDGDPGVTITNFSTANLFSIANPATGNWQISVSGSGAFSITVTGIASFDLKSFNFVEDPGDRAHEPGLFPIDGFPVADKPNMVSAELTDGVASAQFELRTPAGATLQVLRLEQGTGVAQSVFVGSVIPPASPFLIYATGTTASGAAFQRLLPGTIRPQSVTFTAPSPVDLVPGSSTIYTFEVHNLGSADTFHVEGADDKGFLTSVTPANLSLNAGETREVTVRLQAPADAVPGTSDTLTVTAAGGSGARNFDEVVTNVTIPIYIVFTSASPPEGGTTTGSGTFSNGATDTVKATPSAGYRFVSWTENGSVVSTLARYTFRGSSDRALLANFVSEPKAATPTMSPPGGNFSNHPKGGERIRLSCPTPGATIYYTKNGGDPTTSSIRYPTRKNYKGFKIKGHAGSTKVVKAISAAPGYNNSDIATASFTFGR